MCIFQIDEDGLDAAYARQAAQQFPHQARLAHSALRRQQSVGSLSDTLTQCLKLDVSIEESISVDPVAARFLEPRHDWLLHTAHHTLPTVLLATILLGSCGLSSGVSTVRDGPAPGGPDRRPELEERLTGQRGQVIEGALA